jgi:regulator of protease activity HflC (stomatin/prohibitin superfamily)
MAAVGGVLIVLVIIIVLFLFSSVKIVLEYERAVIFRLGRCVGAKGPGVFFIIPIIDKIRRVNLQIAAVPVASQAVITRDNVTITVDAVAYFQVVDPLASVVKIQNWYTSAQLVAQTTLRSIIGRHEMDQMLSERDRINNELQIALDAQTEAWGIKVHRVEIRDVGLPEQMQRAMARQAEAERERRAKIIAAEGELQASQKLGEAADVITRSPGALQLRQLQTMTEISAENSSTIIFPIPIEIMGAIAAVTNSLGGPQPPPVIVQREATSTGAEEASSASEINSLPDVEVPPSEADITDTSPASDAGTTPDAPYPDLPPPPTAPPPPPPPVS